MTRKILSVLLVLILCFSLGSTVCAAETGFIVNDLGYLADEEVDTLNLAASAIYDQTGVGIFFVYAQTEDVETFDFSSIVGDITDYVVMLENETHWYMHLGGRCEVLTFDDKEALRAIYDETDTYLEGVLDFLEATAACFPPLPAAAEPMVYDEDERFLYDEADLLTDAEEEKLAAQLEEISHGCSTQLVICTLPSTEGIGIDTYVDYLYDSMGFGYGETREGVLLLISMGTREYRILSNGYAGEAIGPQQIDTLCDIIDTYLPQGNYASGFFYFAEQCEEMLAYYQAGSPFKAGKNLAISLAIGLAVSLIAVFVMKSQLTSVHMQNHAVVYVRPGSMHLRTERDIFLYRNVHRVRKTEQIRSSSSGSGGSTRSKGGGSF